MGARLKIVFAVLTVCAAFAWLPSVARAALPAHHVVTDCAQTAGDAHAQHPSHGTEHPGTSCCCVALCLAITVPDAAVLAGRHARPGFSRSGNAVRRGVEPSPPHPPPKS